MDIKMLSLCLCLLGSTVFASLDAGEKDTVRKYTMKLSKDGKELNGEIDIDTKKGTESFHLPAVSDDEETGDVVYDFKRRLTMIRLPKEKSCFLHNSTDDVPKPEDLIQLLENSNRNGVPIERSKKPVNLTVVGTLEDRSELSDEMEKLCAKLPIYIVAKGKLDLSDLDDGQPSSYAEKPPAKRVKRGWGRIRIRVNKKLVCRLVCSYKCYKHCNVVCYNVCKKHCNRICNWIG